MRRILCWFFGHDWRRAERRYWLGEVGFKGLRKQCDRCGARGGQVPPKAPPKRKTA
jgi:hypothetical protein